jgi:hypothetical protein
MISAMSRNGTPQKFQERRVPWYFEKTGPSFFNAWSFTHLGWGVLFQSVFPGRFGTGLMLHTIYESIEGYIFPAEFRDVSMRNHVGDTLAFTAGMLVMSSAKERARLVDQLLGRKNP